MDGISDYFVVFIGHTVSQSYVDKVLCVLLFLFKLTGRLFFLLCFLFCMLNQTSLTGLQMKCLLLESLLLCHCILILAFNNLVLCVFYLEMVLVSHFKMYSLCLVCFTGLFYLKLSTKPWGKKPDQPKPSSALIQEVVSKKRHKMQL